MSNLKGVRPEPHMVHALKLMPNWPYFYSFKKKKKNQVHF